MSYTTEDLRAEHESLVNKIARLQKQADGLWDTILYLEEKEKVQDHTLVLSHGPEPGPGRPPKLVREATPLVKMIAEILEVGGGMMHRKDILKALEARGRTFTGDNVGIKLQKLGAHLSIHKNLFEPVTRPGDGRWRLKENRPK